MVQTRRYRNCPESPFRSDLAAGEASPCRMPRDFGRDSIRRPLRYSFKVWLMTMGCEPGGPGDSLPGPFPFTLPSLPSDAGGCATGNGA